MKEQLSVLNEAIKHKTRAVEILSRVIDEDDLQKVVIALNSSKQVSVQYGQPPSKSLHSHIHIMSDDDEELLFNDPLIEFNEKNSLINEPWIRSKDVETAILADTGSSSVDDVTSIPI